MAFGASPPSISSASFLFTKSYTSFQFRTPLPLPPLLYCVPKIGSRGGTERLAEDASKTGEEENSSPKAPEWKKINSKDLGITSSKITKPVKEVLDRLHKKGYDVFLVGGCVRDLILKRTPKDFDVITSADLYEVRKVFSRCLIVGRRFPICHVHIGDSLVEVSSFGTIPRHSCRNRKFSFVHPVSHSKTDVTLWKNSMGRDFTINGLLFDPYAKLIYDYIGGLDDLRKAKVRTVIPAQDSFGEDCARILRAVRIAARLGFRFSKETARSLKRFSSLVMRLDKSRLLMEMNYMLAYGSAEASLRLLWKFGLLEILLPIQASYFVSQGFKRRDERSNMLLALFSNLDKHLAPDQPCHSCLWLAILAFHLAVFSEPQEPLVVATFVYTILSGGDLVQSAKTARRIEEPPDITFRELLEVQQNANDEVLVQKVMWLHSSVRSALGSMTDEYAVAQAMARYPQAPSSDLVFIPFQLYLKVCSMFDCVEWARGKRLASRDVYKKINYTALAGGEVREVRCLFARVVLDTVYPSKIEGMKRS